MNLDNVTHSFLATTEDSDQEYEAGTKAWMQTRSVDNFTNQDVEDQIKYHSKVSATSDYILTTYLLIIGCMALFLNGMVLLTMYKKRHILKPVERFLAFLATNDLFMVTLAFPMPIVSSAKRYWYFGETGCSVYAFLGFLTGLSNISTLATMSVFRCFKVIHPNSGQYVTKRLVNVAAMCCYLYALVWSLCPFFGWGSYGFEVHMTTCTIDWLMTDASTKQFINAIFICCVFLPTILIISSYSVIVGYMVKFRNNNTAAVQTRIYHVTAMSGAMCGAFLFAWTPYAVMSLIQVHGPRELINPKASLLMAAFAKTSVIYNPCIYCLTNKKFRESMMTTLSTSTIWQSLCRRLRCSTAIGPTSHSQPTHECPAPHTQQMSLPVQELHGLSGYESTSSRIKQERVATWVRQHSLTFSCASSSSKTKYTVPQVNSKKRSNCDVTKPVPLTLPNLVITEVTPTVGTPTVGESPSELTSVHV